MVQALVTLCLQLLDQLVPCFGLCLLLPHVQVDGLYADLQVHRCSQWWIGRVLLLLGWMATIPQRLNSLKTFQTIKIVGDLASG